MKDYRKGKKTNEAEEHVLACVCAACGDKGTLHLGKTDPWRQPRFAVDRHAQSKIERLKMNWVKWT